MPFEVEVGDPGLTGSPANGLPSAS
jgi:hypothetical protein